MVIIFSSIGLISSSNKGDINFSGIFFDGLQKNFVCRQVAVFCDFFHDLTIACVINEIVIFSDGKKIIILSESERLVNLKIKAKCGLHCHVIPFFGVFSYCPCKKFAEPLEGIDRLIAMAMAILPLTAEEHRKWCALSAFKIRALSSAYGLKAQVLRDQRGLDYFKKEITNLKRKGLIDKDIDSKLVAFSITSFTEGVAAHLMISPKIFGKSSLRKIVAKHINAMVIA